MNKPRFKPYLIKLIAWDINGHHIGQVTERGNADNEEQVLAFANQLHSDYFSVKRDNYPYCKEIKILDNEGKTVRTKRNFSSS